MRQTETDQLSNAKLSPEPRQVPSTIQDARPTTVFSVDSAAKNLGELIRTNHASRQAIRNGYATTANTQRRKEVDCEMSSLSRELAEFESRNFKLVDSKIACKYPNLALVNAESQMSAEGR